MSEPHDGELDELVDEDRNANARLLLVVRFILCLVFSVSGAILVARTGMAVRAFDHFGYSHDFMILVGALELAGAVGLLVPVLARWAALGLGGIMLGAIYTHLRHDSIYMALPALVLLGLLATIAARDADELRARPHRPLTRSESHPFEPPSHGVRGA